jgi:hypothetical protein
VGPTEYLLLALVILVPLAIAAGVTLWSLEQVRYRPKRRRRPPSAEAAGATSEAAGERTVPPAR